MIEVGRGGDSRRVKTIAASSEARSPHLTAADEAGPRGPGVAG